MFTPPLNGHSWVLHVFVEGPINPETGFVMDFAEVSKWVNPIVESLDHRHLGTIEFDVRDSWLVENMDPEFYPSSENLVNWIGYQLISFPWSKLAIEETCTSYCELTREEFDATSHKS